MSTEENKATKPVQKPTEEKKDKKRRIIIILSVLCFGLATTVVYLLSSKQEVIVKLEKSESTNVDITEELTLLQADFANLETDNEELNTAVEEQKARIAEMLEEAEKHKDDAYIIAKLKKETKTLRKIMMGFVKDIDSLNTLNQNLIAEKEVITENLNQEKVRSTQLEQDKEGLKETVRKGSVLTAQNVRATGIRLKSGGSKESETTKAKRAEQIKASFILGENRIAEKGEKEVFMRILTPDGKELSSGINDANRFAFNGVKGYFCAKESIDYQNEEMSMSLYAKNKAGFIPGTYKVEIYADETLIGHTTLILN